MKRIVISLVMLTAGIVQADEAALIRRQFIDYHTQSTVRDSAVLKVLGEMESGGTWSDIDYESQRRGAWLTLDHLNRVQMMAEAYANPNSGLYQKSTVRKAVLMGLEHWIDKDYRNSNWWNGQIGTPMILGTIAILMGDDLPEALLKDLRPILNRSKMGMTGQNKVWCAGIAFMKGLLYDEPDLMDKGVEAIWSELCVSTKEGIQPDWSFHQHGPQQQFGNYGLSFSGDMIKWGSVLRGTEYALEGEKLEILRNYMFQGLSWTMWNRRMDLSGCGRQIDEGSQASKGRAIERQLKQMIDIDPDFKAEYELCLAEPSQLVGFNPFWRSDMAIQRRPDWYASVKMSSTRVIGAETCNSENMQGLHLGDGTLLIYRNGREYEDIVPVWDWHRLPGTTCDQGLEDLTPKGAIGGFGGSDFAGVLGDGGIGMAAMVYKREGLSLRKAWFFFEDEIVCLGHSINGKTLGPVFTSIQQSWLNGEVTEGDGWIHHDGIGYAFMGCAPVLKTENIEGNWNRCFPTRGDRPTSGKVFSLWIDHGVSPLGKTYAYRIFPSVTADRMDRLMRPGNIDYLINSSVQAVVNQGCILAVFYKSGKLEAKDTLIEVDAPCMLKLTNGLLTVSDPAHTLKGLRVTVDGRRRSIDLPFGNDTGRQVTVEL